MVFPVASTILPPKKLLCSFSASGSTFSIHTLFTSPLNHIDLPFPPITQHMWERIKERNVNGSRVSASGTILATANLPTSTHAHKHPRVAQSAQRPFWKNKVRVRFI